MADLSIGIAHLRCTLWVDSQPAPAPADMNLKLENWRSYLIEDSDTEYLLDRIQNGLKIVDSDIMPNSSCRKNYRSATQLSKLLCLV